MEEAEESFNEIGLCDPLLDSNPITCSWGVGNQLIVCASDHGDAPRRQSYHHPILLHEVHWNRDMQSDISRKLLNESHQIFLEVQRLKVEMMKAGSANPQLVKLSRKYRSVLRACVLELKAKAGDDRADDESENQMQLFRMMEIIWHLCEILFIENSPAGVVLSRLLDWCKWHFTQSDDLTEECMNSELPYAHESYWSAIKCLVLQGRTEDAQGLLKLHPEYQTQSYNCFSSMDELLRKMPHFSYYQGQSVVEFEMKWNHWQDECRRRLEEGDFSMHEGLQEIALILCGDDDIFENLQDLCGGWYQVLVSRLLFTQPTVSMMELQHHGRASIEMCGGKERLGAFDYILLAAFELDPYQVIKECSQQLSNWWLATHLADLFHHSGLLSQKQLSFGIDFHELLLLEYASSLMSHESLWQVTIDYLAACCGNGQQYLSLFVQRIPLTSEKKASKLLRACEKRGLIAEAQGICRQMSVAALKSNRLGTALMWSLKSNDSSLAMQIAEQMLEEYAVTGEFQYVDLLDYLGPSILVSERLTFLGKYREFHKMKEDGLNKDAGNLLLNLLISKIAPVEFWPSLLLDSLPLLECEDMVFSARDSSKLLGCLNNLDRVDAVKTNNKAQARPEKETQQKKIELLRLALARNLARAVISDE